MARPAPGFCSPSLLVPGTLAQACRGPEWLALSSLALPPAALLCGGEMKWGGGSGLAGEGKGPGLSIRIPPGPVQKGILSLTLGSSRKFCGCVRVIAEVRIILGEVKG